MKATSGIISTSTAALSAAQRRGGRMPFSMPAAMCMSAFSAFLLLQTGVIASVSLFVSGIVPLLPVVGLVVLISLLLIGLTGLVKLGGLVGLIEELTARTVRGE